MHEEIFTYLEAFSNENRLRILGWLKDPTQHFPPQTDGDLVEDGVCSLLIAEKLGITESTTSRHMKQLLTAGLIRRKKIKQWSFYQRDEEAIQAAKDLIQEVV